MQLRETFKNSGYINGDKLFAVSASMALHICVALTLIASVAISAKLKSEEDPIIHVSLVSIDNGQKSQSREIPDSGIHEKDNSKNKESKGDHRAAVRLIEKKDRAQLPVETASHTVAEMQPIKPTVVAIPQPAGPGTKDTTTIQYDHKGQHGSVVFGNTSVGAVSLTVPRYRKNPPPVYPLIARMRGHEGVVLISTEVLADGSVGNVKIKKSSGYSPLDQSALNAVRKWMFEPAKKRNTPLSIYVDIPVRFSLNDNN